MALEGLFANQHRKCSVDRDSIGERDGVHRSAEGNKAGFVLHLDLGGHLRAVDPGHTQGQAKKLTFP